MVTMVQGADEKLIDTVRHIQNAPQGWICIHYHFSSLGAVYKGQQLKIALNIITTHLSDSAGSVIACEDKDIFIFSRLQKSKVWEELSQKLRSLFAEDPLAYNGGVHPNPAFSDIYSLDIKPDMEKLLQCCTVKVEAKKAAEKQAAQEAPPAVDTKVLFDEMVVKSGKKRRIEREGLQVLVVEDENFSRRLLSSVMEKEYETLTARNGADALHSYAINFPDIVFLDIQMPDLNGHAVMREILTHDPQAYIVMLSANSSQKEVISSIKEGAKGFIVKPFKKDKIQAYIDKYRAEKKNHAK